MRAYSLLPRLYRSLGILTGEEASALEADAQKAYDNINTLPTNSGENKGREQKWTYEHDLKSNVGEKLWFRQLLPLVLLFLKRYIIMWTYAPIQNPLQQPQSVPLMPPQPGAMMQPQQQPQPQQPGYGWL